MKPADQLQLTEAELKVEHERILNAKNPYAPDNIVRFNFSTNEFQKDIHVDHFATHFQLKGQWRRRKVKNQDANPNALGNLIHKESDEAQEQAALGNVQEGELVLGIFWATSTMFADDLTRKCCTRYISA